MSLVSWSEVLSSPDYAATVQPLVNRAALQGRAIPQADPNVRAAISTIAARKGQLQEAGADQELQKRQLALQSRRMDLEQKAVDYERKRQPWATALGLVGVGVQGLSSYADYKRYQRSELAASNNRLIQQQTGSYLTGLEELKRSQASSLADIYRKANTPADPNLYGGF